MYEQEITDAENSLALVNRELETFGTEPQLLLTQSNLMLTLAMYKIRQPKMPEKRFCGHLNPDPAYPYRCTKPVGHHTLVEPELRRHGYAGVFWL